MSGVFHEEAEFSTSQLSDGSPVLVLRVNRKVSEQKTTHGDLPESQQPMVVMYPHPTLRQSLHVIFRGIGMLCNVLMALMRRYVRGCNLAYTHIAHIQSHKYSKKNGE